MARRRSVGTAALGCALALSLGACDGGSQALEGTAPTGAAATTSAAPRDAGTDPATTGPFLDPGHAVDPPGPRTGQWAPPDILVTDADTIPGSRVRAIRRLRGVTDVERISQALVPIENRAISVAAVDPSSYRNFVTDVRSAETGAVWRRVADGELALRPTLRKALPIDHDGFLAMGSASHAPSVHVGAYARQTWRVDAVVNDTWAPDLGMTRDNALLIRTGGTAPDELRKPIERILAGTAASVQMTDAVARFGLDPDVVQTAVVVGTIADAVGTYRYSVLGGGRISPDAAWVASHITTDAVPILGQVTCNRLIFPQLRAALEEVVARGLADEIHPGQYAGCYNPRFIAGTTTLSNHAFGLALDLNVPGNQRGTVGQMDRSVVSIFEHWGFTWGGRWHYTDPMHFELNRLVRPG
jgi:hypothetical protein